jgi:hypothetical protein
MDYLELAEQCERLAQRAGEGEYRTLLEKVAAKCRALADQVVAVERAASHNRRTSRAPKSVKRIASSDNVTESGSTPRRRGSDLSR